MVFEHFNSRALDFDINNALAMAYAAELAYPKSKDESAQEWRDRARATLDGWGFHDVHFFDAMGTQAYLAGNEDKQLLSFRGTEMKIADIKTDLNYELIGGPLCGKVHEGFLLALLAIWAGPNGLGRVLKQEREERRAKTGAAPALWVTGHSLGAALATMAAAKLAEQDLPVWGVYTFGSPRVGDAQFCACYDGILKDRTYRVLNNNDIVGRVPLRSQGYRHVGRYFYLKESGVCVEDPSSWMVWLDMAWGRALDLGELGTDGVKDHKMNSGADGYIPALLKSVA